MTNLMDGSEKTLKETTAERDEAAAVPAELADDDGELMEQSMNSELSSKLGAKVLAKISAVATTASQKRVVNDRESGEEAARPGAPD